MPEIVKKFGQFPTSRFRVCTDRLKIQPSKLFYAELAQKQGGFQVWLGMRSRESNDRKERYKYNLSSELIAPHDMGKSFPKKLNKAGVWFRLPVLDWSEQEILEFLGDEKNPLYMMGCKRVGCFPCLASGDRSKEHDFNMDAFGKEQYKIVKELEVLTGKSIWTSKSGAQRNNENQNDLFEGCAFCAI